MLNDEVKNLKEKKLIYTTFGIIFLSAFSMRSSSSDTFRIEQRAAS
jgi:hypothetical protein